MKEKLCRVFKNRGFVAKIAVVTSLVLTVTILGATYAFRSHNNELDNRLKAHSVSGAIIENGAPTGEEEGFTINPGSSVPKVVQFKNTSDADVFVRISYVYTWMDEDGALLPHNGAYASSEWSSDWNNNWSHGMDGWSYYNKVLKPGESTPAVLESVRFASGIPSEYADGKYQLTFVLEVVQCSDEASVNNAALLATFGKSATVSEVIENDVVTGRMVTWN